MFAFPGGFMVPSDASALSSAAAESPKRLHRLIEPVYADLPAAPSEEFIRLALERTAESFGEECGLEAFVVARLEGARWKAFAGADERLLDRLQRISRAEHEIFLA